ncbi:hypothetical protein [Pontibacillus sp. HMF3514]|uniref:hypothetical protein n=1 Tax=Pontibacillus sp. HMF3514 TaxID=2692425 RepID=UPI00131FD307|nr:hypothetical protein [Pontibacillus sp. HMF3514]QHE52717.1 hypothetical protein GS400_12045 [Pontibacillus sp. HMF3514]
MKYKYSILLVCITLTLVACASEVSEDLGKDKTIPEVIEKELDQITEVNHFEEVFKASKEATMNKMLTEDIYELKKSYADQFVPKNAEVMSFARLKENVVIEYTYNQLEYSVLYISHNKKS